MGKLGSHRVLVSKMDRWRQCQANFNFAGPNQSPNYIEALNFQSANLIT